MKKFIVTHDTTLLSTPTIPTSDCNQITDSGMGIGTGQILYGIIVPKKRMGIGFQNFLHISSPDYISGKEVIGQYVPVDAVKEILTPTTSNISSRENMPAQPILPVRSEEKTYSVSNILIGLGLLIGGILSFTTYKKYTYVGLLIIAIGFGSSLYKQYKK